MKIRTALTSTVTQNSTEKKTQRHPTRGDDRSTTSVADYLSAWLDARQTLRPSTRLAYEIHLRRYLIPHLGHLNLTELSLS